MFTTSYFRTIQYIIYKIAFDIIRIQIRLYSLLFFFLGHYFA